MPKAWGRVFSTNVDNEGRNFVIIQVNGKLPKKNEVVRLKWGSIRTTSQNALYWVYLTWLINEGGLKRQGHFLPETLHENLKAHFLAEKIFSKGKFKAIEEGTTTQLTKSEFGEYIETVDQFINSFFGIDTSAFWEAHKNRDNN